MILKDYKLTQNEFNKLMSPLVLDLQAYYNIMKEAVLEMVNIGIEKGWTPERLIQEIDMMFREGGNKYIKNKETNHAI